MIGFQFKTDAMGRATTALAPSADRHVMSLAAGAAKSLTVPAGAEIMLTNATGNVWVQYGGTSVLPAADILTGGAPELNPGARWIHGVTSVSFIAAQSCLVSVSFFGG
ncbi:hypothetical protein [Niveispirillum sp. KHB5.9]|uniref:hypothetical protein n=1 Tax=Niveispirillum sp. KHB5.9 TaxID=3400269 RepID=UPI003A87AA5B